MANETNVTRRYMLMGVQQHKDCEFRKLISACRVLCDRIENENPKCAEQLEEMLRDHFSEERFREFLAVYTASLYHMEIFRQALNHFTEYQRAKKAFEIVC